MAKKKEVVTADVSFNMTPMIDCTFQLIIFFILASQVANESYAKNVQAPRPEDSLAVPASVATFPNKVTVNVIASGADNPDVDEMTAASADYYQIGTERYQIGEWDRMADVIRNRKKAFLREIGLTEEQAAKLEAEADKAGKEDNPTAFFLEVRADKRVNWSDVFPVISAGSEAGISKMNITALTARPK